MTPEEKQKMFSLTQQIAVEDNRDKLIKLVGELNDLLAPFQKRLEDRAKKPS